MMLRLCAQPLGEHRCLADRQPGIDHDVGIGGLRRAELALDQSGRYVRMLDLDLFIYNLTNWMVGTGRATPTPSPGPFAAPAPGRGISMSANSMRWIISMFALRPLVKPDQAPAVQQCRPRLGRAAIVKGSAVSARRSLPGHRDWRRSDRAIFRPTAILCRTVCPLLRRLLCGCPSQTQRKMLAAHPVRPTSTYNQLPGCYRAARK
jgi:hypothetical protein